MPTSKVPTLGHSLLSEMPPPESVAENGDVVQSPKSPPPAPKPTPPTQPPLGQVSGLSQSNKDDIGVCVVIILITILAIIVTIIKIILFDISAYPELFGGAPAVTTNATTK